MLFRFRSLLLAGAALLASPSALANPLSAKEALGSARTTALTVERAKAEVAAAEGRAVQAGLRPNPEVSATFENFAGTGPFRAVQQSEATVAFSQPFELGGKRTARREVAARELEIARLNLALAYANLEYAVRLDFAELLAAQERADLARTNLEQARELVRVARALVDAGRDPPLRQLRAEALLAQSEAEAASALRDLLAVRRRLAFRIGSEDPELVAIPSPPFRFTNLDSEYPTLDEKLAAAQRAAADARIALATAQGVPDLTATAGVRRFQESGGVAVIAGISLPLPLFNRNQGNFAAARAESAAIASTEQLVRREASLSRRQAVLDYESANARLQALENSALNEASEAVRLAGIGYRAGKFGLLDLIDAQQALSQTRHSIITARLDRDRAEAALIRALAQ